MSGKYGFVLLRCALPWLVAGVGGVFGCAEPQMGEEAVSASDGETPPPTSDTETTSVRTTAQSDSDTGDSSTDHAALMAGTYGLLISASSKQIGIPLVKTQVTVSRSFFLVDATADGPTRIRTSERLCGLQIKLETWLNKSIVPQQFIEHSGLVQRTVDLDSAQTGAAWRSDDVYEVRGARLADPAHDPLPASGSADPGQAPLCDDAPLGSQCDQDLDGQPGMTNVLSGALSCRLFIAQRWHAALDGQILDRDTIAGPLSAAGTEQTVLAASTSLCEQVNMQTVDVIDKCPEHFYFKMVRLSPQATCADVMALTSCDEDLLACEGQQGLPLNPRVDDPLSCK